MCGILGSENLRVSLEEFTEATKSLVHRGPDNTGIKDFQSAFLGHTRLSIIDLSEEANQPMQNRSGRYWILFNGEIYNYLEIRSDLQQNHGYEFLTGSDTEVLLAAFEVFGEGFVTRLNGMFSIVIYDSLEGVHYLYRDRVGIKPLYYMQKGDTLVYSSEIKAIIALVGSSKPDRMALRSFLNIGYIPEPLTAYGDIRKFPSGSIGIYKDGELNIRHFWNSSDYFLNKRTHNNPVKQILRLIENSVSKRLIADVPVGTFLSGGIDSSLVTLLANRAYGTKLPAFHVSFENSSYDESVYARDIARRCGAEYHEICLRESEALEQVESIIDNYDEPFADPSAIPTSMISRYAVKFVKVSLSGDGGDELFYGYGRYQIGQFVSNPLVKILKPILNYGFSKLPSERFKRISRMFHTGSQGQFLPHLFSQEQGFFSQSELDQHFPGLLDSSQDVPYYKQLNLVENQNIFDINSYLKDDLLVKVDRASMQHSLEVRVPLLDHELLEYILMTPFKEKWKNGTLKHLLKEVMLNYFPPGLFNRPKWGLSPPMVKWLRTDLKYLADQYLSVEVIESCGLVNVKYAEYIKQQYYIRGVDHWYYRIWTLILLHRWWLNNTIK